MRHRNDIQGLRAVAVLLVIFAHVGMAGFDGGWIGVDVFFVISGFLITSLLNREYDETHHISLLRFYIRRAKRILPASLITIAVVVIASSVLLNDIRANNVNSDAIWSVGFLANIHLIRINTDYFAISQAVSPLQHFWSLAVEEQFYLIWPALFLLVSRQHGIFINGRDLLRSHRLIITATLASALSLAWSISYSQSHPTSAYFSTLTRVWELGFGVLLACCVPAITRVTSGWTERQRSLISTGASWLGLAAIILGSCLIIKPGDPFPGALALIPVLGAVGIIFAGLGEKLPIPNRILSIQPLPFIGTISFSLYLWHWPVHVFAEALYPDAVLTTPGIIAQLVVILAISLLSYFLIENPARRLKLGTQEPEPMEIDEISRVPFAAAVILLVGCVFLYTVSKDSSQSRITGAQLSMESAGINDTTSGRQPADPTAGNRKPAEVLTEWDQKVQTSLTVLDEDGLTSALRTAVDGTTDDGFGTICKNRFANCAIGSPDRAHKVALFGDSHAQMLIDTVMKIFPASQIRVYTMSGCATSKTDVEFVNREAANNRECNRFRDASIKAMLADPPDVLLISDATAKYADEGYVPQWIDGQRDTYDRLMKLPQTTTVVHLTTTTGTFDTSWEKCLGAGDSVSRCFPDPSSAFKMRDALVGVAGDYSRIRVVDIQTLLCDGGRCPPAIDGLPVYKDGVHFAEQFRLSIAGALGALLVEGVPELSSKVHTG